MPLYVGNGPESGKFLTYIDGLVEDCSISIANPLELQLSYTNPYRIDYKGLFTNVLVQMG